MRKHLIVFAILATTAAAAHAGKRDTWTGGIAWLLSLFG